MERRSGRGRQEVVKTPVPTSNNVGRRSGGGMASKMQEASPPSPQHIVIPASEIPAVESEEIVLNRRGMPARQRKRNRFYFDDDMVTPENWGSAIARNAKKVKTEPVEVAEEDLEDPEDLLGDLSDTSESSPRSGKRSVSPVKQTKSPTKESPRRIGRNSLPDKGSPPRRPTLQLHTPGNEKPQRGTRNAKSPKHVSFAMDLISSDDIKPDPDGPIPEPVTSVRGGKKIEQDRWTKMVQRKDKLKQEQDAAAGKKSPGKDRLSESPDKKLSKKEQERQQQEKKQKEQERLAKERLQKEKDKKTTPKDKEKKRDSITTIPPMIKVQRGAFLETTEIITDQQRHQTTIIPQQQIMAFVKIDDPSLQTLDKRMAHDISIRLRNLLKLPKAHKWVCYEWFYSNIDKVLFEGENDFQICLKESFPTLKARKLTRTEWTKIRRLMGKPRRCSQAFFDEEREELAKRRAKIRQIQQRKVTDFNYKELPDEIPLQLVIGTKVTARLRRPQDGLFTGTIEGVDTSNNTYRITFDRPGLGTHSIPDYEVLSNDAPETVSTSSFALKIPRRSGGFTVGTFKFQNSALLSDQPEGFPKSPFPADGMLGGFPIRLLDMIVRLSKLLKAKREKIMTLKELNVEAEKLKSYGRPYNTEYRARYARCVLDLDSMNKEMGMYLEGIQTYCLEITNDHGSTTQMIIPEHILDNCRQEASMVVSTYNCKANRTLVHNQKIVGIVHQLTSLMLQVRALSTSDRNLYELKSLKDTIRDVKASLEGKNLQCFQNKIEIPMNRIIAGLCVSQPKAY